MFEVQLYLQMLKLDLSFIQPSDIAGRPSVGQLVVPAALVAGPPLGFPHRAWDWILLTSWDASFP